MTSLNCASQVDASVGERNRESRLSAASRACDCARRSDWHVLPRGDPLAGQRHLRRGPDASSPLPPSQGPHAVAPLPRLASPATPLASIACAARSTPHSRTCQPDRRAYRWQLL